MLFDLWRIMCFQKKNTENIHRFEKHTWTTWAKIVAVYDGDTVTLLLPFKGKLVRWRTRLMGYDAPEMKSSDEVEKAKARSAKFFLINILPKQWFRVKIHGIDKYGRLLVDLKYKKKHVSQIMIEKGHGVSYDGKTKSKGQSLG